MQDDKPVPIPESRKAIEKSASDVDPKFDRILSDTKSLSEDVSEWLRLKVQLIQIEIHERVSEEVNALLSSVLVLSLMVIAMFLALMALGLYLGEMLQSDAGGLAIVAAAVAIVAIILGRTQPQWVGDIMFTLVPRRWTRKTKPSDDTTPESKT